MGIPKKFDNSFDYRNNHEINIESNFYHNQNRQKKSVIREVVF